LAGVGATVTLSYRGDGFKRCKQGNQKRLADMLAAQQLAVLLESNVQEFTADEVRIKLADGSQTTIPNQRAFVLIGADTPVTWLEANNVRFVERPHLYALGSSEDVVRRILPEVVACTRDPVEAIAMIRGQQAQKKRRVREVVDSIRGELQDVVTSVSVAFRLSDLETPPPRRHGRARTPLPGIHHTRTGKTGSGHTGSFATLTRLEAEAERTRTATALTQYNQKKDVFDERTGIDGRALRPRVHHVDPDVDSDLDNAFARATRTRTSAVRLPNPQIASDLEQAFDRATRPRPPATPRIAKPAPPKRADAPNPFDDDPTDATVSDRERP
ncbi:MAG: hypothetical protein NT062_00820, partial [Proteobacteria bacterium]|nr:hypothetical protein [Pseudomonadota bacterium]